MIDLENALNGACLGLLALSDVSEIFKCDGVFTLLTALGHHKGNGICSGCQHGRDKVTLLTVFTDNVGRVGLVLVNSIFAIGGDDNSILSRFNAAVIRKIFAIGYQIEHFKDRAAVVDVLRGSRRTACRITLRALRGGSGNRKASDNYRQTDQQGHHSLKVGSLHKFSSFFQNKNPI